THPLEDLRSIDLGERLRTGRRIPLRPADRTPAEELWRVGSIEGALACGFSDEGGSITASRSAPELDLVKSEHLLDAIVYSGGPFLFFESSSR
ncbi:MAG TPA: formimidoylglutamate deiminase, partial [Polyangiaceae bacterium]|nr:formimidoylglutamate deiminase [Polyangiaceae bacterium]